MQLKLSTLLILCFSIVACGGGSSSKPKNLAPIVNAGTDQQAQELASVSLSAQASDDDGTIASVLWTQLSGSNVALSVNNSLSTSFSAPLVSVSTEFSFQITATDNQGATSSDVINITIIPIIDNPIVSAGEDQTVIEKTLVTLTATATDTHGIASQLWTQTSGTGITLNTSTALVTSFTAPDAVTNTILTFQLTVTDNRGAISQDEVSITIQPGLGNISGIIKYENISHTLSNGLDYANTTFDPVRGADVELLDSTTLATTPVVIASTTTNNLGEYSFDNISSGQSAVVRVKSTYVKAPIAGEASWDMQVIDNTNSDAIYALDSTAFVITPGNNAKNLTALSGWSTVDNDYTSPRAAAPFHILDRAYDMVTKIVAADADVIMPAAKLNWSIKNAPANGDKTNGLIGTSHYTDGNLYILGLKDNDTDEYDGHVILHELGHYIEDKLSRADSIGGGHSGGDRLDMRVAFGEGFGNAWSGIISDDSFYRDSSGSDQGLGFSINVESNSGSNPGWYSESSVQSILYDIYDADNEAGDSVNLGFAPIYNVLIGAQKITPALTSIFSFGTLIKSENASASADIDTLLSAQGIVGSTMDIYGSTETNDVGGSPHILPVYTSVATNGIASAERCSINTYSTYNKLSVSRFFHFTASSAGSYTITANPSAGSLVTEDPDIFLYKQGILIDTFEAFGTVETGTKQLASGDYTFAITHYPNYGAESGQGTACFTATITQN